MRVHHVAMRTFDLERLERFYAGVLGLGVVRRNDRSVWLDAAGTLLMLEQADDGEPPVPAASKELLAFAITPGECAETLRRLSVAGVSATHETAYTSYFRDPDGRRVALSHFPERCNEGAP